MTHNVLKSASRLPDDKSGGCVLRRQGEGGRGQRGRGLASSDGVLWALPRRRTANSTRRGEVCKHDGLWRTSQGPLFALAEHRRPLCSLASLNYCLHVNTKLHKQDSGRKKKKAGEKNKTKTYIFRVNLICPQQLPAALPATVCFESQIYCIFFYCLSLCIVHNLHNCLTLLSKGIRAKVRRRNLHNGRCSDM